MEKNNSQSQMILLATVGMPGSGKSETAAYFSEKGFSLIRFGDATDEGLKDLDLLQTPENEAMYREKLREEMGMAAYAKKAEPKISDLLTKTNKIIIDGLYSWEEYKYLVSRFPMIQLLHIYAGPDVRYERLSSRPIRPFTKEEARSRDISEIEKLNKGGPIAMADFIIINDEDLPSLHAKIDELLTGFRKESA